ncbi:MAG: transporter substrate-binding domain-containing protein [Caldilineaceae bacterium]|nr:transporter substrate-binding domain-containing protein [Caldilineaceae bacterium]
MRYLTKPRIFIFSIAAIALVGVGLWVLPWLLNAILSPALPDRTQASTAAIITQRGKVRIGVRNDVKPFGYLDSNGQLNGFDIDLAREIAYRWFQRDDAVELVVVSAADRIPRLAEGDVDLLIAAMPHKRERDALIDFSEPYFVDGQTLLVRADSALNHLSDLHNKTVAAIQEAPTIATLQQLAEAAQITLKLVTFPAYPEALIALQSGQIDALTGDAVTLSQFVETMPTLRLLAQRLTQESYGIGLPQGDSPLRALVNFTLQDMKIDGTYDRLYRFWFPADEPLAIDVAPGGWSYRTIAQLPTDPVQPKPTRLESVLQRKRLIVAVHTDFWPFSTVDNTGQRVGFDIDLVREFARRWLGDANAIEFVVDEPTAQIQQLANGEVDLIAAALVEQREWATLIDFSQIYLGLPVVSLPLAIGVPQQDPNFRELVNVTLQEMKADGSYDAIFHRWFGAETAAYNLTIVPGDASYLLASLQNTALLPRVKAAKESAIARIRQRNQIMRVGVATSAPPFGYQATDGSLTGFDVELARALAQEWSVQLELVPVSANDRVAKLLSGEVDLVAAGMLRNKADEAAIDFSQTYFVGGATLLVRSEANVQGIADLQNRAVAILETNGISEQLQALAEANGVTLQLATFATLDDALAALSADKVAGVLGDPLRFSAVAGAQFTRLTTLLPPSPYGLGLPAGDSYFHALVNSTLQKLKRNGVYDQLYHKWFGADATPYALEISPGTWPYRFQESPTTLDLPVRSKVEEIQTRRKMLAGVLYDYQPFGFLENNTQVNGFDIDLVREFATRWLGDAAAVEFVPVTFADSAQKLAAGEIDLVAAALPQRQEQEESIDYSQRYYRGEDALLVQTAAQITTMAALHERVVAVIQGSPVVANLQTLANQQNLRISILPFQELTPAFEALKAGQVDAVAANRVVLERLAAQEPTVAVLAGLFASEPYGLGLPNDDGRFQDLVNFTLQEMAADGTYARIYRKWFAERAMPAIELWSGTSYLGLDMVPMVRIPAGEFLRGYGGGFPDERFEQTLAMDEFYLDRYEVTNRQYAACVQAGRCALPRLPRSVNFANYYASSEYGNYPVIWVTWGDAVDYCAFRGKRLPTEAEWEKAARGSLGSLYPWGDREPTTEANFNYAAPDVAPVGAFGGDISSYGVYDLAGNVREWVADWYQWDYYLAAPTTNPPGPAIGVTKVLRGGSWNDIAVYLRSTSRKNFLPESFDSNLGFRCASSTFPPSP